MGFKSLWGSNQSRTFKVAAWVAAIGLAAAWNAIDLSPSPIAQAKSVVVSEKEKKETKA